MKKINACYKKIITSILIGMFAFLCVTGCSFNKSKETENSFAEYIKRFDNEKKPETLTEFETNIKNSMTAQDEDTLILSDASFNEVGNAFYSADYDGHQFNIIVIFSSDGKYISAGVMPVLSENEKMDLKAVSVMLSYLYCGFFSSMTEPFAEAVVTEWLRVRSESVSTLTIGEVKLDYTHGGFSLVYDSQ